MFKHRSKTPQNTQDLEQIIQENRMERDTAAWESLGLSTWPPYDWGDVDPNILGNPVIHLPGGVFEMDPDGERP